MSVTTLASSADSIFAEIESSLENLASVYSSTTIKSLSEHVKNVIEKSALLSGFFEKDKEEEVGRLLYERVHALIESVGDEFYRMIQHNFSIRKFSQRIAFDRSAINKDIEDLEHKLDLIIVVPDKGMYDMLADREINDHTKVMEKQFIEAFAAAGTRNEKELVKDLHKKATNDMESDVKYKYRDEFLNEHAMYLKQVKEKNDSVSKNRILKGKQEKATILDLLLKIYDEASRQIVAKITQALTKFPYIASVLKGTATVRSTKEEIPNPYENENLSGILEILYDRYQKKSFVGFTNSLIDAMNWKMSEEDTQKNPSKGVSEVQQIYANWERKELWKQLTKDQFFTCILMKGLHPNVSFRREVLTETTKFIQLQDAEDESTRDPNSMPIFKFVCDYINREQQNRKMMTGDDSSKSNSNAKKKTEYQPQWQKKSSVVESAASAKDSSTLSTSGDGKLFSGEVNRSANIRVKDDTKNKDFTYLAVDKLSKICPRCFPEDGNPTSPCERKCYQNKCVKCGYYGHKMSTCLQSHKITGEKIDR